MIRVLVADDLVDVRRLVRDALEADGRFLVVAEAADGEEAIAQARLTRPDVVLLDLAMPVVDGAHAIPEIKAAAPAARVVAFSGVDPATGAAEALASGADGYFDKAGPLQRLPDYLAGDGEPPPGAAEPEAERPAPATVGPPRVLLVEDNPSDARLCRARLASGMPLFEVDHVTRLADAANAVLDPRVRCVLLDLSLPDAEGFDAITELTARAPKTPIVVLTGRDDAYGFAALEAGAEDYLTKNDVDARALARSLRYAMERKRGETQLLHQALHDATTGLPNRRLFLDRVEQAVARSARADSLTAVFFLDLDGFKPVNDTLGHEQGDLLLTAVGQRLRQVVRPADTVARVGGDEFTILCEGLSGHRETVEIAERLVAALREPFLLSGGEWVVTASVGIATTRGTDGSSADLIRDADAAMYRAKQRGPGCFEMFSRGIRHQFEHRVSIGQALRRAIAADEMELAFQPIVDLDSREIVGAEALLRWRRADGTVVPPAEFIPLAEENGLIVQLGELTLREACRVGAGWHRELGHPVRMSVNLSARQLAEPDLPALVAAVLEESGLDPHCLSLEITESSVMNDAEASARALNRLKDLGVSLAVDDFGTGYSSLVYLRKFPVDVLKIDRSFVHGLGSDPDDGVVVQALVGLAAALGHDTVAEGVEEPRQVEELRRMGCRYAQGYLFGCPMEADEFAQALGAAPPALPAPRAAADDQVPATALRVLLVEDSPGDARLIQERLAAAPEWVATVVHVDRLAAAHMAAADTAFDLVLLDLGLPDATGEETLLRMRRRLPDTPVIVLTTSEDDQLSRRAIHAGAQDYLPKSQLTAAALARAARYALERQAVIAERRRLEEGRQEFLAAAVHELRNPMGIVMGALETVRDNRDRLTERRFDTIFDILGNQASRFSVLARDLLDLSRAESGRMQIHPEPVSLRLAVEEAARNTPAPEGVRLEVAVPDSLSAVADPIRLGQVLENLLSNAYRYGGGTVEVTARQAGRAVTLSVRDGGPGVPPEFLPRLFEPFARGHRDVHGSGLGLAIARRLVEAVGGGLRYDPAANAFEVTLAVPPVGARQPVREPV